MIFILGKDKHIFRRFVATALDYLLVSAICFGLLFIVGDQTGERAYELTGSPALIIPLIWIVWFPVSERIILQTLGKKIFGLYIIDIKGGNPAFFGLVLKHLTDPFEMMLGGAIGLFVINYSRRNQRFGDMMAETTVIAKEVVCKSCNANLELTTKEVLDGKFVCPMCNEVN